MCLAPEDRSIYDIDMILTKGNYVGYHDDDDYVEILTGYEFFFKARRPNGSKTQRLMRPSSRLHVFCLDVETDRTSTSIASSGDG